MSTVSNKKGNITLVKSSLMTLFSILLVLANANASRSQSEQIVTLTLLHLNDVYQITPVDRGLRGGLARVNTLRKKIEAQSPHTLFLLAGDFIAPSVASRFTKGKHMVETLNTIGLDIATLGNHEFDFGADVLRERMSESRFAYTVANTIDKRTGRPFGNAHEYIIVEMAGVRVGVFGLLLPETATLSFPGPEVRFDDPIQVGKRISRLLRSQGVDVIIALTHLTMRDDKKLALEADIDLIIGGHEHELLQSFAGRAPILKVGSDARYLGRVDLNFSRRPRERRFRLVAIDFQAIPVTDAIDDQ